MTWPIYLGACTYAHIEKLTLCVVSDIEQGALVDPHVAERGIWPVVGGRHQQVWGDGQGGAAYMFSS